MDSNLKSDLLSKGIILVSGGIWLWIEYDRAWTFVPSGSAPGGPHE